MIVTMCSTITSRRRVTRSATKARVLEAQRKFSVALYDLQEFVQRSENTNIKAVTKGKADGELIISYAHKRLQDGLTIRVQCKVDNDNPPPIFQSALEKIALRPPDWSLCDLASKIEDSLDKAVLRRAHGCSNRDVYYVNESDSEYDSNASHSSGDGSNTDDDMAYSSDESVTDVNYLGKPKSSLVKRHVRRLLKRRISHDLQQVESAGYAFEILRGTADGSDDLLISISTAVTKLGFSPAEILAWGLSTSAYIVFLIRVSGPYTPFESLLQDRRKQSSVSFRLGQCTEPVPSVGEAAFIFGQRDTVLSTPFQYANLTISKNLQNHMEAFFWQIAQIKEDCNGTWEEAYGLFLQSDLDKKRKYSGSASYDSLKMARRSFPLVAMQFSLDQLERCRKYCPICHQPLAEGFQAVRPTVCLKPTCRFQCATIGLGPSVEHEILFRPGVVDLLVSLFYASLHSGSRRCSPALEELMFPLSAGFSGTYLWTELRGPQLEMAEMASLKSLQVGQLVFIRMRPSHFAEHPRRPVHPDPWGEIRLAICPDSLNYSNHSNYSKRSFTQEVIYSAVIKSINPGLMLVTFEAKSFPFPPHETLRAEIHIQDLNIYFPVLVSKARMLRHIMDSFPPVSQLRSHLQDHPQDDIESVPGVTPLAASMLRWIMATNQSCIMEMPWDHRLKLGISGSGWTQFCLLQAPPNEEARFGKARAKTAMKSNSGEPFSRYPSIFGWHGSPIQHWHSILRTGLDYNIATHGRSYGDGVYFSDDFSCSYSYSSNTRNDPIFWPSSGLRVQSVLSLNEILNAPTQFVNSEPHYVLDKPAWHICRFLFVRRSGKAAEGIGSHLRTVEKGNTLGTGLPRWSKSPAFVVQDPHHNAFIAKIPTRTYLDIPVICPLKSNRTDIKSTEKLEDARNISAKKRRKI
ncbi:ubiquitin conjugating enzyme [Grosmannia clavigera kw1407]|uniref:Ubiquitin conjugating enzyme n=1 Tax=Grosmannia clavigera (strain kw1407 / UAMH 11150) TaxID=655863 RepID=F0XD76_GROCL|nr:ubiquitin conjugating enzyme [Grosmannia clavigera kw1407]EFX04182.1 ubiquitin conjugating enzyme [Grosmannia clavigera kw1407]